MKYAKPSKRLAAYIIDLFVVLIISNLVMYFVPTTDKAIQLNQEILDISQEMLKVEDNVELMIEYQDKLYEFNKEALPVNIVSVVIYIGYFMIYQYKTNGKTIGKQILKMRLVSDKGKLQLNDVVIRSLLIDGILITMLQIFITMLFSKNVYLSVSAILTSINSAFVFVSIFMILYRKDRKGLQDIICKTSVIKEEV